MAFTQTPSRKNAPSQLLPLSAILSVTSGSGSEVLPATVTITGAPVTGIVGSALALNGTVSPNGTAVRVGLSTSSSTPATGWTAATVSGSGWTASIIPNAAGTYFIWVEQSGANSVRAVSSAVTIASSGGALVAFTTPPTSGIVGGALSLGGTVSPSGTAVRVGISASATTAPASWTAATVSGAGWTAALTPAAVGTYYLWAEQTGTPSVQAVSAAVTVSAGGSTLTYSLISGSGDGSLSGITLSNTSYLTADWASPIAHGATDVAPNVQPSSLGSIAACKFWFDTTATNITVPSSNYGNNSSINSGVISFYPASYFATPTGIPAAPSTPGTYYGKYAMYDSNSHLLGVYVTSAIAIV